jgi:ribosomal protein S18 acetylase RimI-like enzyme
MVHLRAITEESWEEWRALRLRALEESPEAFGSTLAGWQGSGDTEARWRERLASMPLNLLAELDGHQDPVGMVSALPEDEAVELLSLYVAAEARGYGVGDQLIEAVVAWVADTAPGPVMLRVRAANQRAMSLYRRHGFTDDGEVTLEGSAVPVIPAERWMRRA